MFSGILKGRAPLYENEIIITEIVAEEFGLNIGDMVIVSYREDSGEYFISGFHQTTNDFGRCLGMSLAGVARIGIKKPDYGCYTFEEKEKLQEIADMLNEKYSAILTAEVTDESGGIANMITLALKAITAVIYVISVIFTLVVVNMICAKTFLKEKRDIGIYKAVGFTTNNLRMQFAIRFLIISLLGSVFGILLSILLTKICLV